ncbi:nickel pincer cofactor biosynthesis protein LarC [Leptolyngbya cf. ectocarpi LEGE 11479]|uniref:Putative nickel insertion protein n=1 Tax=Leptolyngbya cf. ectocarpi LEGE 11479 TaxID=1828722 RepID=A0A928X1F9_LEPEC|nr:nickel pincer cofactor biosynthesis protein LarC [Leptolyngbya ectocarpi]MBE9066155.1 nickel pincer cofactor biosynthesis protein LarC [Leptolyngbya cf. ectocarpi LEGE 11479]
MEKIAYFDCPTGIAGNMCLGAILSAGMPLEDLLAQLQGLGLQDEYEFTVAHVRRQEQAAIAVTINLVKAVPAHRHLPDIEALIRQAQLPPRVVEWSLAIFRELAAAEAAVHGIAAEQVHFHEVGATDALVDVVGTCLGLHWLGVDRMVCSPLPVGGGTVKAAHGRLPVPAPAVLELLRRAQAPIYSNGIDRELVTPTGAAIATTLSQSFGPPPAMTLHQVGLGAGSHDLPIPNILRLWIGTRPSEFSASHSHASHSHREPDSMDSAHSVSKHPEIEHPDPEHPESEHPEHQHPSSRSLGYQESIVELQTQLDDLTPQAIGYLYNGLFQAGALDVFTQAIGMKKNRPGILLTVICPAAEVEACQSLLFSETTTLGIRTTVQQRQTLYRAWRAVTTDYGPVQVKAGLATPQGPVVNLQPEYETCAQLARAQDIGWKRVQWAAIAAAQPLYNAHDWQVAKD